MMRSPRRRITRTDSVLDDGLVTPRVGGVDPGHRPFGLRHHLLGHHHDVAVVQAGFGGGDQAGQVVALAHLGDALDREDLEAGHAQHHLGEGRRLVRVRA